MMTNRITTTFDRLRSRGEKALIPYIMAGDPSLADTEKLIKELAQTGADLIELGVPFSDPIADGPVIQKAAERALRSGTSLKRILETVTHVRIKVQVPLILMAYYNTIMAMGEDVFCREAVDSGIDGVIVPDMPPEEDDALHQAAQKTGLMIIYLLAPTSTNARRKTVVHKTDGFIYYVSLTGITGSQLVDMEDVKKNIHTLRRITRKPIAVGFGIATPEDAKRVALFADGVIVGSAMVRKIADHQTDPNLVQQIGRFTQSLKAAILQHPAPSATV